MRAGLQNASSTVQSENRLVKQKDCEVAKYCVPCVMLWGMFSSVKGFDIGH